MNQFLYWQKQAWLNIKKRPGFVMAIVTTMGVTLGALLCVLTLAYTLIVNPLPYPNQDKLYRLDSLFIKGEKDKVGNFFTYPGAVELYKNQNLFSAISIMFYGEDRIESDPLQPNIFTAYVTPEWFTLLGAKLYKGRYFENTENIDSNSPVAILSYKTWLNTFASDPNILNKKIIIAGKSYNVVGVLAESFIEPRLRNDGQKTDIFLPWDFNPIKKERAQEWKNPHPNILLFGSLSSQLNKNQIEETLTSTVDSSWQDKVKGVDFFKNFHIEIKLNPLKSVILGDIEKVVYLLLVAVFGLVLIALTNISNLFMSRTAEQQRQLSIQAALGATKKQLFKGLFAETGQLMLMSITVALIVANLGFIILQTYFDSKLPRVEELSINGFTLGAASLITLLLALFFAYLSSGMINYKTLQSSLHSSGKGSGIQVSKRTRKILIVSQIAIVSTLIFINFSILKESFKVINQPIGFNTQNTYLLSLRSWSETAEAIIPGVNEIVKKLEDLPQVKSVSQSYSPLGAYDVRPIKLDSTNESIMVQSLPIDDKYFNLIEQKLLEGDLFTADDVKNVNKVIIVNDVYAKLLAPNSNAVGLRLRVGTDAIPSTIVGVVKSIRIPGETISPIQAYYVFPSNKYRLKILIKLKDEESISREELITLINSAGAQVSFWNVESLDKRRNDLLFTQFTTSITSSFLVIVSYLLAAIGLYGILSYSTQLRRFELSTRMAIGAKRKDIIKLIIKDNLNPVLIGFFTSIIILVALFLIFAKDLKNYIAFDSLLTFFSTLILVSIVALIACYWPLRKFIYQPIIRSLRGSD